MTNAIASSSKLTTEHAPLDKPTPGLTAFHESSQYRRWRFSAAQLASMRQEINGKARETTERNIEREKELRIADGSYTEPKNPPNYPSPQEELELVNYYVNQLSTLCKEAFDHPLPEVVEGTAISYMKRFFTQASCMEYHPKSIIPVVLFLAGKTNNTVYPLDEFTTRFAKLKREDIVDLEFTVIQKLKFDVYVQRLGNALHGWFLKMQELPGADVNRLATAYATAKTHLARSRRSDAEFIFSPSQISLACMRMANAELVDQLLDMLYPGPHADNATEPAENGAGGTAQTEGEKRTSGEAQNSKQSPMNRQSLEGILQQITTAIQSVNDDFDIKSVKDVDRKLKSCLDPMRNPESALRKQIQATRQAKLAEKRAVKVAAARKEMSDRDTMFGPIVGAAHGHEGKTHMGDSGMGVAAESGGMIFGGEGLRDVGMELLGDEDDSDSD